LIVLYNYTLVLIKNLFIKIFLKEREDRVYCFSQKD
jgi:hypothetical protein